MSAATAAAPAPAAPSTAAAAVVAEPDDERFELLDEMGYPLGTTERRAVVHAKGLYHRAVYCFVRDARGRVLLQRRSAEKKVGPNQWDLSVAEHLSPGEGYVEAVLRGLQEELGVTADQGALRGPLNEPHVRHLANPEKGIFDNEYVQSFELPGYEGPVDVNAEEVSEVRWVSLEQLQQEMEEQPQAFTVWLREELALVLPALSA